MPPAPPTPTPRWRWVLLLAYWVALTVGSHWPRLDLGGPLDAAGVVPPDKVIHVVAFAGLTALLAWALRGHGGGAKRKHALTLLAVLLALAWAGVDEFTQQFTQRTASLDDLTADALGVLSMGVVLLTSPIASHRPAWLRWAARWALVAAVVVLTPLTLIRTNTAFVHWLADVGHLVFPDLDAAAHLFAAGGMTALLALVRPSRRPRLTAATLIGLMIAVAPLIELVQIQVGRSDHISVPDMAWHYRGMVAALFAWNLMLVIPLLGGRRAVASAGRVLAGLPTGIGGRGPGTGDRTEAVEEAPGGVASSRSPNPEPRIPEPAGFVKDAAVVAGLTLVSRATGLVRDAALAAAFGLSGVADAFFIGFLVPNLFRRLFGEGALSAAFIPQYTKLTETDPAAAKRFARQVVVALVVLLAGITVLSEGVIWLALTQGWAGEADGLNPSVSTYDRGRLALRLTMWMLPYMPMVCLVALLGGLLQVHRRFGPAAAAPVVLNLLMIAAAVTAVGAKPQAAFYVAASVLVAGVLQVAWLLVSTQLAAGLFSRAQAPHTDAGLRGRDDPVGRAFRGMLRMMGPMILGLAVFQINALLDSLLALWLSPEPGTPADATVTLLGVELPGVAYPMQTGDVAALAWAQRLYQFPLGVFGIAIATAIFPALAAAAGATSGETSGGDAKPQAAFTGILRRGLRLTMWVGLPAAVGLILVREPLSRVVYERFEFTAEDAARVATILAGYALAIPAYSMTHVLTRGFYAREDATTPLKISLAMVTANLVLNLLLVWPLGPAGLAYASAVTACGQVALLLRASGRVTDQRLLDAAVLRSWAQVGGLSLLMAAVLVPVLWVAAPYAVGWWHAAALLLGMVTLGGIIVLGGAVLLRAPELHWLRR